MVYASATVSGDNCVKRNILSVLCGVAIAYFVGLAVTTDGMSMRPVSDTMSINSEPLVAA